MTESCPDEFGALEGPFGRSGWEYHLAEWTPLPIPCGKKGPPPRGLTGATGQDLSGADVQVYLEERPNDSIAVRAPLGCIGLDVDQYAAKAGWDNLEALRIERGLSPLPPTWRSSARPEPSGIYWFRLPVDVDVDGRRTRIERTQIRLASALALR